MGRPAGRPSTTTIRACPWDSPAVRNRSTRPNLPTVCSTRVGQPAPPEHPDDRPDGQGRAEREPRLAPGALRQHLDHARSGPRATKPTRKPDVDWRQPSQPRAVPINPASRTSPKPIPRGAMHQSAKNTAKARPPRSAAWPSGASRPRRRPRHQGQHHEAEGRVQEDPRHQAHAEVGHRDRRPARRKHAVGGEFGHRAEAHGGRGEEDGGDDRGGHGSATPGGGGGGSAGHPSRGLGAGPVAPSAATLGVRGRAAGCVPPRRRARARRPRRRRRTLPPGGVHVASARAAQ